MFRVPQICLRRVLLLAVSVCGPLRVLQQREDEVANVQSGERDVAAGAEVLPDDGEESAEDSRRVPGVPGEVSSPRGDSRSPPGGSLPSGRKEDQSRPSVREN